MTLGFCFREKELRQSLKLGHWPEATPAELLQHVEGCRVCGELLLVSQALQNARAGSVNAAGQNAPGLVSPGLLWWKAQLRRRNEAVKRIGRPLLGAQIFALAVNVLILIGVIVSQAQKGGQWVEDLRRSGTPHLETLWSFAVRKPEWNPSWSLSLWIPCAAMLVVLSGIVAFLASEKS